VHAAFPVAILYFPATHSVQVPPLGPDHPALHLQAVSTVLCTGESDSDGQLLHAADPRMSNVLNLPTPHSVHVSPSGPVQPALHSQAVAMVLCTGELELDGQVSQAAAPGSDLYVPTLHTVQDSPSGPVHPALHLQAVEEVLCEGELECARQILQDADPGLGLYVPEPHCVHISPLGPVHPELHVQAVKAVLCTGE